MSRVTSLFTALFAAAPFGLLALQKPKPMAPLEVQKAVEIRTMLKGHCATCHSSENPAAGLDLTTVAGIQKGGVSGKLFDPAKPQASLLLARLNGHGGKPRMPLGMTALTDDQIKKVADWIASGGRADVPDAPHWAYVKPKRRAVPSVKNAKWVRNPIDSFVLSRLEHDGLRPSPEASKEVLLRRVYLDLIGLPPTVEEIDAFLADKRPDAYEKVVEKLLASPHYGERQARPWLDLARYADTDGYEKDLTRTAWKWRDWVIEAFNENMPFDRFTIEQIAGDQLPGPTVDQLVATGFHRNTMMNLEGGVDPEEQHFNVVLDRVGTTSTVWLGQTLACARCHDHKYDPLSQKDFFRMAAFFSNAAIIPRGTFATSDLTWHEPNIEVPSPEQVAKRTKLRQEISVLKRRTSTWTPELKSAYETWLAEMKGKQQWEALKVSTATAKAATLEVFADGSVRALGKQERTDSYTLKARLPEGRLTGIRLEAQLDDKLPKKGPGRTQNGNFVVSDFTVRLNGKELKLAKAAADFEQNGYPARDVFLGEADKGWAIDPEGGKPHEIIFGLASPVMAPAGSELEIVIDQTYTNHTLGKFGFSVTSAGDPVSLVLSPITRALFAKSSFDDSERARIEKEFLGTTPLLKEPRERLAKSEKELAALQREIPTAMIMRDKPNQGPLSTPFRERGEFQSKKEPVLAGVPTVLPQLPNKRVNRLDLAKWLVSKENPLTARVQVNRMWEQVFGRGIVETSENFGTQGTPASHPELLDWLAVEFMAMGWDLKHINRLIVTSATYRQSSNATAAMLAKDPSNELLARGPRFRMEAEMIRDSVLAAGGLLNRKIGGRSVMPYQPDGVWDTPYSGERWMVAQDGDQYRRGLYTFWKRTAPYASFMALDATSREECTVRRTRTNTPLQALALLNDQATFDAARNLGAKMKGPIRGAIVYGFRSATSRRPSSAEVDRLEKLYGTLKARYAKKPAEAKKLGGTPDMAARILIANTLLNLDETVTKG